MIRVNDSRLTARHLGRYPTEGSCLRRMGMDEVSVIAMTSAATFAVLDLMAPSIGVSARKGAGFGIGTTMVGGPTLNM